MPDDKKRAALFVSTLASFLTPFMGSAAIVAVPAIARQMGMDAVIQSWIPTAYLLSAAVFLVPFRRLADLYGRKRFFLAGMTVFTLGSLAISTTSHAETFLALRVVQGVGGAMIFGTGIAIITSVFPPGERGRALGINTAAVYLGLSAGPTIGGLLTQHWGWRSVFAINVPIGLFIIAVVVRKLRGEWADARGERFDLVGALLFILFPTAATLGATQLPARSGVLYLAAAALLFVLFVLTQLYRRHPLLEVRVFLSNRVFALSNLAALIAYAATAGVGFLVSQYLQHVRGFSPREAGLVLVAQPIVMALLSPRAGHAADRIEPRILTAAGMACVTAGLFLFGFLSFTTPVWQVVVCLVLVGTGFGVFSSPNTLAVMSAVEKRSLGVASATLATMRATGQVFSMGVTIMMFAVQAGRVEPAENLPGFLAGIRLAFHLFAGLCLLAVLASLVRGRIHTKLPP
ncbi:MFS transporter [bacterium]|nr:MFS transporter [bacterium]